MRWGCFQVGDLAKSEPLGTLVQAFLTRKKPICAIGYGVAGTIMSVVTLFWCWQSGLTWRFPLGLCPAMAAENEWCFSAWNLTSISVYEHATTPFFSRLPLIVEDFIKDNGGLYNAGMAEALHVITDRNLVTAQNVTSTALAIATFQWLLNN